MLLGAVTYHVLKDYDLESFIKSLKAAGFEGVELARSPNRGRSSCKGRLACQLAT